MLPLLISLTLLTAVTPSPNIEDPPPVFVSLTFEEAREQAKTEDKLLVLDAMTSWCGPCKKMDVTTWIDPELVRWMGENTIAVQLDMDEHEALKKQLKIAAFPTIIAFDAKGEADRLVGYRDAKAMGDWLQLVRRGGSELERMLEEIVTHEWNDSAVDLRKRARYASELIHLTGYSQACDMLLEIWKVAPAVGFERSTLRWNFGDLARQDAGSRTRIEELRRTLDPGTEQQLADWINLSVALQDHVGLDAWVLGQEARGQGASTRNFGAIVYPLLLREGHWRSAGICLKNPIDTFERSGKNLATFDDYGKGGAAPTGMTPAMPIGAGIPNKKEKALTPAKPKQKTGAKKKAGVMQKAGSKQKGAAQKKSTSMMAMPMIGAGAKATADSGETGVVIRAQYRWDASNAYGALLAAGRVDEATVVAATVLRYEDSPKARIALVCRALEAGAANKRQAIHVTWLDQASSAPTEKL